MTQESGGLAIIIGLAWFAIGIYGIITVRRHLAYLASIPSTQGNKKLRRQLRLWLLAAIVMLAIGAWNTIAYLSVSW